MKKISLAVAAMFVVILVVYGAGTTVNGTRVINGDLTVKGTCTGCGGTPGLVGPLDTVTVSGQSAMTTSAAACFTASTYDDIVLKVSYAVPGTSADNLYLRFNSDTGANYSWGGLRVSMAGGSATPGASATNQILLDNNGTVGTNALGWTGEVEIRGIGSGKQQSVDYFGKYVDPSPVGIHVTGSGFYLSTTTITSATFEYAAAGTVHTISGTVKCYGVAK